MRNKILSLLVLLLTAASGAWAQGYEVTFSGFADDNLNTTVQVESLPQSFTQINGYELESSALEVVGDNSDHYALVQVTESCNGMVGVSISPTTITVHGAFEGTAAILFRGVDGNYNSHNRTVYLTCVEKPAVEVNTNAETEGATFTEATFAMPAFDATAEYELVRDMSVQMTTKVGDGNDGYRIRIKKDNQTGKFVPAETDVAGMMALIKVHDAIENEDLTFFNMGGAVDCSVNIYAIDAEDKPVGDPIAFAALTPGRYVATATAAQGSAYDGTTAPSNIFELYQGYEVTVPAGEYATFYKNENLYVEDENAELYTISSVTDTEAVLSEAIDVAPALTPLLVFNSSDKAKTILLIPTEEEADNVEAYEGFKGTLEAKEMSGSNEETDFYVCNGKNFVWVKGAGTIGANKCWLEVSKNAAARKLNIVFGESTGVNEVSEVKEVNDNSFYDLNGRKVLKPNKKGVYIMNGKKVVIK